jgi:hypothetical protein
LLRLLYQAQKSGLVLEDQHHVSEKK